MKREIREISLRNRALRVVIIAVLAVVAMLATSFVRAASAAGVMDVSQSNAVIDLSDTSKNTDDIQVNLTAQPGDILTFKLDSRLWSDKMWPSAAEFAQFGTVDLDEENSTVTLTFSKLTEASTKSITVSLTPQIDNSETLNPRDDTNLPAAGDYTFDATLTHTDSTSENDTLPITVKNAYTAGDTWDKVVFSEHGSVDSYHKDTAYTFTMADSLRVTYSEDAGSKVAWDPNITRMTLSMPADLKLDAASSTGWTQGSDGTLTYDPTVSGAVASFTGSFEADVSDTTYTAASDVSEASGYFGTPSKMETLKLVTPFQAKIVASTEPDSSGNKGDDGSEEGGSGALEPGANVYYSAGDKNVYVPNASTEKRSDTMGSTYEVSYSTLVLGETLKDVDFFVTAPDGSHITDGRVQISHPVAGQTYTLDLETADGQHETVTHMVTQDEANSSSDLTITIPTSSGNTWVKASFLNSEGMPKDSQVRWSLNFKAQSSYDADASDPSKDLTIKNGDTRYSTAQVSGTGIDSGKSVVNGYNIAQNPMKVNPVTYYTELLNADLGMAIDSTSSNTSDSLPADISYFDSTQYTQAPQMNAGSTGAPETTAYTIFEPVFYVMAPKKTTFAGQPTVDSSIPQPKITTYQTSNGQNVAKLDWTGTDWSYNTRTDSSVASGKFSVKWAALDEYGITTTSPAAIWVSTSNDPDLVLSASSDKGTAIPAAVSSAVAKEATQEDAAATLIGSMNVTVSRSKVSSGISSALSLTDNANSEPADTAINVLTTTKNADHKLNFTISNYQTTTNTVLARQLTNLPNNVDIRLSGPITLYKTDGTSTAEASDATVLYSTQAQAPSTDKDPASVSTSGYVTADQVSDWSTVLSFIVDIPASASNTEYYASAGLTDASAAAQTNTWAQISTTFYAQGWEPATTTLYDSYAKLYGVKTWTDGNNQDNVRPDSVTVHLLDASGATVDTATASADTDWKYNFDEAPASVPAADATHTDADFITYTLSEDAVAGYTAKVTGLNVENTHVPATVTVSGTKVWDDDDDRDGLRPDSITVDLFANGVKAGSTTVTAASANADGAWAYSFTNMPKFKDGKEISYTVDEERVTGYSTTVDGASITNTHTPAGTTISGSAVWDDADDRDGIRPDSVTVDLLADGEKVGSATVTAASDWAYSFTDIPEFKAGTAIVYTVEESSVPQGYTASVSGYVITNTHVPAPTTTPDASKTPGGKSSVKTASDGPKVPVASASGALASTGSSVEAVVAVASMLMLAGVGSVMVRAHKRDE